MAGVEWRNWTMIYIRTEVKDGSRFFRCHSGKLVVKPLTDIKRVHTDWGGR